jgi:hypothetical protein
MSNYDSAIDTLKHIIRVQELLNEAAFEIVNRARVHDQSKLNSPEKEQFDQAANLSQIEYGSPEYYESLKNLNSALEHHYANNSHHPQHYPNGIDGMDLFDLIEMFFDWKAATERTKDGNIYSSIEKNKERFAMSDQLCSIFKNTAVNKNY